VRARRSATFRPPEERLQLRRETLLSEVASEGYDADEEVEVDAAEIDEAVVHAEYDELLQGVRADDFAENTRSRFIAAYRELERGQDPYAVDEVPEVLTRLPDVTAQAVRYVARAARAEPDSACCALLALTEPDRFHRESEWVHICRAFLTFPERPCTPLGDRMSEIAAAHDHAFVRARALLAWGAQSAAEDFSAADSFWTGAEAPWRPYVLVAIQDKEPDGRNARFDAWSGEERFLRSVANHLRGQRFRWSKL
jgi:KaiC/GvpD/RAD55 family RecA-like ATPase